ncbi:MAG: metal-dependent transcriptional regulator [Ignavibacteria bacterium]|nr:MAG: metal-dependent transcriptional regulator [Ignavibacteria bacterium]
MEIWKKFEDTELTHSSFHHLWAIYELLQKFGYARGSDVSRHLKISRGSAFITLKKLKERGFIYEDENKFFHLTKESERLINNILCNRRLLSLFFTRVLGVSEQTALEDACKVEHLISSETTEKLLKFMDYYCTDSDTVKKFAEEMTEHIAKCGDSEVCDICEIECIYNRE